MASRKFLGPTLSGTKKLKHLIGNLAIIHTHKQTSKHTHKLSIDTMASYNAINKAVAEVVFAAKQQVLKDFAAFLAEKIDFDEDMQGYFDDFAKTLEVEKPPKASGKKKSSDSSDGEGAKKKRKPSAYNLYIKGKMAEIKEKNPEMKGKELMKAAIEAWNADKAAKGDEASTSGDSDAKKEDEPEESEVEEDKPAAKGKGKGKKAKA